MVTDVWAKEIHVFEVTCDAWDMLHISQLFFLLVRPRPSN